jgi:hypothetical protein
MEREIVDRRTRRVSHREATEGFRLIEDDPMEPLDSLHRVPALADRPEAAPDGKHPTVG